MLLLISIRMGTLPFLLSPLPLFILCQLAYGRWVLTFEVWPPFVILPPTKSIPQVIARGRTRLKGMKFVCREERFKRKLTEISVVHELVERETLSSLVLSSLSGVTNYDFIATYCINLFCTRNVLKRKLYISQEMVFNLAPNSHVLLIRNIW